MQTLHASPLPVFTPFVGLSEHPVSRTKKVGPARRRTEDTSCEPDRQSVGSGGEEAKPSGEEDKPKERDCRPDREVRVELQGSELWKRFYEIGTEMIITKAGRYEKSSDRCAKKKPNKLVIILILLRLFMII